MTTEQTGIVPIKIWLWTACGLALVIVFLITFRIITFALMDSKPQVSKETLLLSRLSQTTNSGFVVLGASLVRHGFPFDQQLMEIMKRRGMDIPFVRITSSGLNNLWLELTFPSILDSRPRWLAIESGLLLLKAERDDTSSTYNLHSNLKWLHEQFHFFSRSIVELSKNGWHFQALSPLRSEEQSDRGLDLDKSATPKEARETPPKLEIKTKALPSNIEQFLSKAHQLGITVILLNMNRSKEANALLPDSFHNDYSVLQANIAEDHQLLLWNFPDLPAEYYADRAHLNRRGRAVFTEWFLTKLQAEYERN